MHSEPLILIKQQVQSFLNYPIAIATISVATSRQPMARVSLKFSGLNEYIQAAVSNQSKERTEQRHDIGIWLERYLAHLPMEGSDPMKGSREAWWRLRKRVCCSSREAWTEDGFPESCTRKSSSNYGGDQPLYTPHLESKSRKRG